MPSLSQITIAGHIGRDAETKEVGGSTVCEFSVAVTTKAKGGESTAWYRCALWGKRGESLAPHLTKGIGLIVSGQLVPREWTTKEDQTRTSLDIRVDQVSFAGGPSETKSTHHESAPVGTQEPPTDDNIPF